MKTLKQQIEALESAKKARITFLNEEKVRESFLFDKNVSPPLADDDPQYAALCDAADTLRAMLDQLAIVSREELDKIVALPCPSGEQYNAAVKEVLREYGNVIGEQQAKNIVWVALVAARGEAVRAVKAAKAAPLPQGEGE